ncbi:MAG: TonB family protein [Chitinophagaceae bacterium]
MENSAILTADILDIVFDGRNKEYGAYDLRRTYNKRLRLSIAVMLSVILLFSVVQLLASRKSSKALPDIPVADTHLADIKLPEEKPVEPPPVKQLPPPQQVEMKQFTPPKIVDDKDVKDEEKPPVVDELEDTKIGTTNQEGLKDDGVVAPPVTDAGNGIAVAPKKEEEDWDKTFTKVEIESSYPGGMSAWARFLNKNLSNNYPQEAIDNEIQGTVVIQFIVDKEGVVSDVEAISGPAELREAAIKVIRKSGKWNPAEQNGRKVKSYKKQPIVFQLQTD